MAVVDLSKRDGEDTWAYLARISSRTTLPGVGQTREPLSSPEPWPRGTPEPAFVTEGREKSLRKLRPRKKARKPE